MKIGLVGIGKIGKVFYDVLIKAQHEVIGIDIAEMIPSLKRAGLNVTSDFKSLDQCQIIFVLVNTVSSTGYVYDAISNALCKLAAAELNATTVAILSTCEPQFFGSTTFTTAQLPVVYNPVFVAQGRVLEDIISPDFVLLGGQEFELIESVYRSFCDSKFIRTTIVAAAVAKLAINTYLSMKIAYANLIGDLSLRCGVEPDAVLNIVGQDRRINSHYLSYGFGFGGPCLPNDVIAMARLLRSMGITDQLPVTVSTINDEHLQFQVDSFIKANPDKETAVLFESITFKHGTNLIDNSRPLEMAAKLSALGYHITVRETKEVIEGVKGMLGDQVIFEVRSE